MRCQICNRETENWSKNKQTGKYESICNKCKRAILDTNSLYTDMDEDLIDDDMPQEDFLNMLKEEGL